MKTQQTNVIKYVGTFLVVALLSIVSISYVSAQSNPVQSVAVTQGVTPSTLDATVYQVENSLKFKVHFENRIANDVSVKIRNSHGQVIHQEMVKGSSPKYIRKFDLSSLPDGQYSFEITNKRNTYTKDFQLQTLSARSLEIDE